MDQENRLVEENEEVNMLGHAGENEHFYLSATRKKEEF